MDFNSLVLLIFIASILGSFKSKEKTHLKLILIEKACMDSSSAHNYYMKHHKNEKNRPYDIQCWRLIFIISILGRFDSKVYYVF